MRELSKEQLLSITDAINEKFDEFGAGIPHVTVGAMRVAFSEFYRFAEEAQQEKERERLRLMVKRYSHPRSWVNFANGDKKQAAASDPENKNGATLVDRSEATGPTGAVLAETGTVRLNGDGTAEFPHEEQMIKFRITLSDDESNADRYYRGFTDGAEFVRAEQGTPTPPAVNIEPTEAFDVQGAISAAGYMTLKKAENIAFWGGYKDFVIFADEFYLHKCAVCDLWGQHGKNMHEIEGNFYCDEHNPSNEEEVEAVVISVALEESTPEAELAPSNGKGYRTYLTDNELRSAVEAEIVRLHAEFKDVQALKWNQHRNRSLPIVSALTNRFKTSWRELVHTALKSQMDEATEVSDEGADAQAEHKPAELPPLNHAEAARRRREELKSKLFAALPTIREDGLMPSMKDYNAVCAKYDLPGAGEIMNRLGYVNWADVARDAGLKMAFATGKARP